MALSSLNPTQTQAWKNLEEHFKRMESVSMKALFQADPERADKFHLQWNDFLLDFSKNNSSAFLISIKLESIIKYKSWTLSIL